MATTPSFWVIMLVSDPTYIAAKQVKAGTQSLPLEFRLLADYLLEQYQVSLLMGDIYYEPVVKTLAPALRLIFDLPFHIKRLPIRNEERNALIGDVFRHIVQDNALEQYGEFIAGEFRVQYIPFEELYFQEIKQTVTVSEIKESAQDKDIVKLHSFGNTFYVFYADAQTSKVKQGEGQEGHLRQTIIALLRKKGYEGPYSEKLQVILDEIQSVHRAGGWYNYFR